ncbi:MAG: PDZ domain-containing protein [Thermoguttaceae bacterium]|jgi:membrane-associated protease RseP (regulator of RpoE activity)|nr:PDZ domain-containing protein [Thermoguttaceae bacterium]
MRWLTPGMIVAAMVSVACPALGQSALERLENEVRKRVGASGAKPGAEEPSRAESAESPWATRVGPPPAAAYLGTTTDDATDRGRGTRVLKVAPGSPADRVGLKPGDLITGLGGVRVRTNDDLGTIMEAVKPGMTLTLELQRGAQPMKVDVTFVQRPEGKRPPPPPKPPSFEERATIVPPKDDADVPPKPPEPAPKAMPELSPPATAQGKPGQSTDDRIAALEQRLRELEQRIAQLERALQAKPSGEKPPATK